MMTNTNQTLTNALPTLANIDQHSANLYPTSRKKQMVWLAMLTSLTLVGQYVLLGLTGLGESTNVLPAWFTGFELVLWGMRGLVEIMVIIFIAMTQTKNRGQAATLFVFEAVLITLIVLTVGPMWATKSLDESIVAILTREGVIIWGAGLAGISALMLAGVATAFKFQPIDADSVVITLVEYKEMQLYVNESIAQADSASDNVDKALAQRDKALAQAEAYRDACAVFGALSASASVKVVAMFGGDSRLSINEMAQTFGIRPATVRGALAEVENGKGEAN